MPQWQLIANMSTRLPIEHILRQIRATRSVLHGAGTISSQAMDALVRLIGDRTVDHSVETGCGVTTLLLSYLSKHHLVFALDVGGSVTNVRRSLFFRSDVVTIVEGPSQRTLCCHRFSNKLQLALLDGPHAYPFPELEYYFLYPHLDTGALLVIDDIHIRSVNNLFQFLKKDEMFQLTEVVRSTAFFTRTDAAPFDPEGDNWSHQNYNKRVLWRYDWRSRIHERLPVSVSSYLRALRDRL